MCCSYMLKTEKILLCQGLVKQLEQLTALLKKQNDKVVETSPDEKLVKELKKKIEVTEESK